MSKKAKKSIYKSSRKFTLDDGSVWTTTKLSEKLGCSQGAAYSRLTKSTDPTWVFRKKKQTNLRNGKMKTYTLDDGSQWTSKSLAKHLDIKQSTASTRLSMMNGDSKRILARSSKLKQAEPRITDTIKKRMFFDPLGHWALINKVL